MKIGRNDPCPCGRRVKYKHCCLKNGIDFNSLSLDDAVRHLTVRGKNLFFINRIAEALQFDHVTATKINSFWDFVKLLKKAMTPRAVREIHLAIPDIWPDAQDYNRCLEQEKDDHSGLFLGSYLLDVTAGLLNRYALYNDSIVMIDPFHDPRTIAPQYSPVEKPEEHVTSTFHYVLLLFQLLPWIEAGIIKLIRDPGDFDNQLRRQMWKASEDKVKNYPELKAALENQETPPELEEFYKDQFVLAQSDDFWIKKTMGDKILSEEYVREYFKDRRENSLYYVDVGSTSQFLYHTSGTNYEMGKYICNRLDAHIITDYSFRWKEMEHDRTVNGAEVNAWSAFGKAFQEAKIKHLDGVMFSDLLRLRADGYLENMRAFLRRVWIASSSGDSFSKNDVDNLTAELIGHINQSEAEWSKIDSNLLRWFGGESILGATLGVVSGVVNWVPVAAVAGAGVVNLGLAKMERNSFLKRYPAGFFINTIREKT